MKQQGFFDPQQVALFFCVGAAAAGVPGAPYGGDPNAAAAAAAAMYGRGAAPGTLNKNNVFC